MALDWKRWLGGDDAGALAQDIVRLGRIWLVWSAT